MEILKPKKWSPTLLNATRNICLRAWEMKMQNKPVEVTISEFEDGKELHEYASEYLRTGNKDYLKNFNNAVAENLELIRQYGNIEVELKLEDELVTGQIDCAIKTNDGWIVIDFKSKFDSGITKENKLQLLCYLYLLQKHMPMEGKHRIGILSFFNSYNPLAIEFAEYDLDYLTDYVKRQISLAEQRLQHLQINTDYCRFCQYIKSCDVTEKNPETVEDMAKQYLHLKELIKRYEDAIKLYVNRTGKNVRIGSFDVGMHTKQKTVIDDKLLKRIVDNANIPYEQVYKPDIYALKRLTKKVPDIANAISYEVDYAFGVKRIEEDKDE